MSRNKKVSSYPSVKFLRASSTLKTFTCLEKETGTTSQDGVGLSGEEAKTFYEKLLKEPAEKYTEYQLRGHDVKPKSTEDNTSKKRGRKRSCRTRNQNSEKLNGTDLRQTNLFLKMAQEGNIDGLQRMLENCEQDINATDQFGWTALMCACQSQQKATVKFLLKQAARTDLCNNKGETVESIARRINCSKSLQDIFQKYKKRKKLEAPKVSSDVDFMPESTFCTICNIKFTSTITEHNSSTAHLFNCQFKSQLTLYHIPESNVGFQLMTKTGWDKEKGLGPEGTGRKFPVKTVLKKDRLGLGSKRKDKARITHFSPRDPAAVDAKKERVARRTSKKKIIEKQTKERKWEQNMRVYMNTE